jgi:hypothetical protein
MDGINGLVFVVETKCVTVTQEPEFGLGYNVMKGTEYFVSLWMSVLITE